MHPLSSSKATSGGLLAAALLGLLPLAAAGQLFSATRTDYTVGGPVAALAVADVNGDGRPDLLTGTGGNSSSASANAVQVRLAAGAAGQFATTTREFAAGQQLFDIAVADVNADGLPDLITCHTPGSAGSNSLGVRLGTGTTALFAAARTDYATGNGPSSVQVADVNADGRPDLVNANFSGNSLTVRLAAASPAAAGTFETTTTAYAAGSNPKQLRVVDVNGDGHPDLVNNNNTLSGGTSGTSLRVRLWAGPGATFSASAADYFADGGTNGLAVADLDGDGRPDLLTTASNPSFTSAPTNALRLRLGSGAGAFASATTAFADYSSSNPPAGLAVADVNGDGWPDLLSQNRSGGVRVRLATGTRGSYPTAVSASFAAPATAITLAVVDVNGDGRPDLISGAVDNVGVRLALAPAPLPVELLTFAAAAAANGPAAVQLAWRTASEKNSLRFDIERSADGRAFAKIGEAAAQGTKTSPTNYAFVDDKPTNPPIHPSTYYRLRQVDLDGTASYSPVRAVQLAHSLIHAFTPSLVVFPNPARTAVAVGGLPAGAVVEVFDALGRRVATAVADAGGTATLALPVGLAAGVYVVKSGGQTRRLAVE